MTHIGLKLKVDIKGASVIEIIVPCVLSHATISAILRRSGGACGWVCSNRTLLKICGKNTTDQCCKF